MAPSPALLLPMRADRSADQHWSRDGSDGRFGEPAFEARVQIILADGLGQKIIHARGDAGLAVARHGVGSDGDDRQRLRAEA